MNGSNDLLSTYHLLKTVTRCLLTTWSTDLINPLSYLCTKSPRRVHPKASWFPGTRFCRSSGKLMNIRTLRTHMALWILDCRDKGGTAREKASFKEEMGSWPKRGRMVLADRGGAEISAGRWEHCGRCGDLMGVCYCQSKKYAQQ